RPTATNTLFPYTTLFRSQKYADKERRPRGCPKANTLLFLTSKIGAAVLPYLAHNPDLSLKVIGDFQNQRQSSFGDMDLYKEIEWYENRSNDTHHNLAQSQGHQLANWADLLFVVADANTVSSMLAGLAGSTVLHVL